MSQNLLGIGFDLADLQAQKAKVLEIVAELYAQLSAFDNTKVSPVNLTGLTQLTQSSQQSDAILKKMNETISDLSLSMQKYSQLSSQNANLQAKLNTLYSEEGAQQAKLRVAIQEKNRVLTQAAQQENEDYQQRKILSDLEEQQTKKEAADVKAAKDQEIAAEKEWIAMLKEADAVATQIAQKQSRYEKDQVAADEQAQADTVKAANDEKIASEQAWIAMMKEASAVADAVAAEQIQAEKLEEQEVILANKNKIKALRDLEAQLAANDKAAAKEAKNILLQSDEYKRLLAEQKAAQQRFTTAYISSKGQDTPEVQAARAELNGITAAVTNVDKELERAGAQGATSFARSLTSGLSTLRSIAYILPGIGIAGIFNLAFEAITKAAQALSDYNDVLRDEGKLEEFITTQINAANEARANSIKFGTVSSFLQSEADYAKEAVSNSEALGEQYYKQYELKQKSNELDLKSAELNLRKETGIKDINDAYAQQLVNVGQLGSRLQQLNKQQHDEVLKIEPGKENDYYKAQTDQRAKVIAQIQKDFDYQKSLLDNYNRARIESENTLEDHTKFVSEEERRVELDRIRNITSETINSNNIILSTDTSTKNERIDAINQIKEAHDKLAKAERDDVFASISATPNDKLIAQRDYLQNLSESSQNATQQAFETNKLFYEKQLDSQTKTALNETEIEEKKNEEIYTDDKSNYVDRIQALGDYLEDRKKKIYIEYNHELELAKKNTPADLFQDKKKDLDSNRDKQLVEEESTTREKIYSVIDSWYKKQLDLITQNNELQSTKVSEEETKELNILNKSFENKELSYRRFNLKRQKLEQDFLVQTDIAKIKDDEKRTEELLSLRADLTQKVLEAEQKVSNATKPQDKKDATDELNKLLEESKNLEKLLSDNHAKTAEDQLKLEEDKNKLIEEGRRQLNQNLIELERQLFEDLKQIADAGYEARIEKLQQQQEAYDEQVSSEKEALDKSSLNEKDKIAYETQLDAQKAATDKKLSDQEKKIKHDEAVFNRDADIAQIILNTEVAVTEALRIPVVGEALAITYAALGAAALATAVATKIPSFAQGVENFEGGWARFGEAGTEIVKEPKRPPYFAFSETIKWLPKGTDIIPTYNVPNFSTKISYEKPNDTWEQTRFLANVIRRTRSTTKNYFNIDLGSKFYRDSIIYGER